MGDFKEPTAQGNPPGAGRLSYIRYISDSSKWRATLWKCCLHNVRYLLRQLGTSNLKKVLCVNMFPSFPPETSHMMRTLSWKFAFEILRFPFDCTFTLPTNGDTAICVDPAALTVAMRFQWLPGMDLLIYFHVTFPRRMLDLHFKVTSLPVKPYTLSPATEKSRII